MRTAALALLFSLATAGFAQKPDCHVTWVADPIELLASVCENESFLAECRGGNVGDLLQVLRIADDPDPRRLLGAVRLLSAEVPVAGSLSWPAASSAAVGEILRASVLVELCAATFELEDYDEHRRQLAALQTELADVLQGMAELRGSLWLRMRSGRTAEQWFERFAELLAELAEDTSLWQVDEFENRIQLQLRPTADLDRRDLAAILDETVFVDNEDDPWIEWCWAWLQRLDVQLELRIDAEELVLTLGKKGGAVEAGAAMRTRAVPSDATLMFADLDVEPFTESLRRTSVLWDTWCATEVGERALAYDTERFLTDLPWLVESMSRVGKRMAVIVESDDSACRVEIREKGYAPAVELLGSGLPKLLPERPMAVVMDGTRSMADALLTAFVNVEGQLSSRAVRADLAGEMERLASFDGLLASWFDAIGPVRDLLRDEAMTGWQPPFAVVAAEPTPVQILTKEGRGLWQGKLPAFAAVTRVATARDGLPLAARLMRGIASTSGVSELAFEAAQRDLELGVPTVQLPLSLVLGEAVQIDFGTGFLPHAFEASGYLVFSTSRQLSESILAGHSAGWRPDAGSERLVAHLATSGTRLGRVLAELCEAVTFVHDGYTVDRDQRDDNGWLPLALAGHALAGLATHFGPIEQRIVEVGDERVSRVHLAWADGGNGRSLSKVLDRVREAQGDLAADCAALQARGMASYAGTNGSFSFLWSRDGRFHNRIDTMRSERNGYDGDDAWSVHENGAVRSTHRAERQMLQYFDMVMTGEWIDPPDGVVLELSADTLPGGAPIVLLRSEDSAFVGRVRIDPTSGLPDWFDLDGLVGMDAAYGYELRDYRVVAGRRLVHELVEAGSMVGNRFVVRRWSVLQNADEAAFVRPSDVIADYAFAGSPEVDVQAAGRGAPQVRVHGPDGSCKGLLMTSATTSFVKSWAARRLGFRIEGEYTATAPEVRVGPLTIRDLPFEMAEEDEPENADEVLGVFLGWAVFRRSCAEFDLAAPAIRLYPPGHFDDREVTWMPLQLFRRKPIVDVELGSHTVPFLLGFNGGPPLQFDSWSGLGDAAFAGRRRYAMGPYTQNTGLLGISMDDVQLGDLTLRRPMSVIQRGRLPWRKMSEGGGLFGREILREHAILLLDYPNERAAFVPR